MYLSLYQEIWDFLEEQANFSKNRTYNLLHFNYIFQQISATYTSLKSYELTSLIADKLFQNNLYSQETSRQVLVLGIQKMEQYSFKFCYVICLCSLCFVNHILCKHFLSNEMVVYYFDYYDACLVILNMTSSAPERFCRSGLGA